MSNSDILFNISLDLIYLVSCSINGLKPDREKCSEMNLPELFSVAKRHALTTISALALEQVTELPEYFKEEKYKAIRNLALYDIERVKVMNALEKNKIWYMPLKGSVLNSFYPKSLMREMTDVDFLCDRGQMDDVSKIMSALGYSCTQFGKGAHDTYVKNPSLKFDMHMTLFSERKQPLFSDYYYNIKDRLIPSEKYKFRFQMTNEDFYIYTLCHMFKHYRLGGTGLRSLLDIYLFNRSRGSAMNRDYLDAELEKLNLKSFEAEISQLALKVFTNQKICGDDKKELMYFIESGRHGSSKNLTVKYLKNDDSKTVKRKYIFRRFFPDEKKLKTENPFVYRHRILYPALIIYRPVKGLIVHPKKLLCEYRRVKNFKSVNYRGKFNE